MRERLFRGKKTDDKEWVEGYLIHEEFGNIDIPYIGYLHSDGIECFDVIPEKLIGNIHDNSELLKEAKQE